MTTWYDVTRSIREMVREDYANNGFEDINDDDAMQEYADEWAGSAPEVIYYHRARELWADSATVQGYEGEAWDIEVGDSRSVDAIISACVLFAMRDEIMDAVRELREELASV